MNNDSHERDLYYNNSATNSVYRHSKFKSLVKESFNRNDDVDTITHQNNPTVQSINYSNGYLRG